MTYIELIVVLTIFISMTSVIVFNYGGFQSKVDIKNLASDIALKIVEAQKSSLSGQLPPLAQQSQISASWKPSYGVYINPSADNKSFIYFSDLNQNGYLDDLVCAGGGECLEKILITKDNTISNLGVVYQGDPNSYALDDLTVTFYRPNSIAVIKSSTSIIANVSYVQITITSPKQISSAVKIYSSGRIQVN